MPRPVSLCDRRIRRAAWMGVACLGLVLGGAFQAAAQTPGLGPADAGGTGMRGTADATDNNPVDDTTVAAPEASSSDTASPQTGNQTPKPVRKPNIPKLRNTAIPERYPVTLPALKPYPTAVRFKGGGPIATDPDSTVVPGPTVAALPVVTRKPNKPDDDPYAPVGYGIGSLRLSPYVEQSIGYDSNPDQISSGVKPSPYSRTEGGFSLQSNWSSHELKGTVQGGYDDFFKNPNANRPDANGVMDLRIDVTRDTKIDVESRFNIDTQRPGSPELNVDVVGRPLVESFGGTLGVTQGFGRFSVGLHGLVDRTTYDNGVLSNGDPVDLAYQDVTDYGTKLRLGYDLKPGLQPFVEVGYDTRVHDDRVDPEGYRRDSDGVGARIGSSFEFWPQFTGTASVGYAEREYADPRLKNLNGPTADGSLIWAATPLTTLTLKGATSFNETTVTGASGIEAHTVSLAISHALFRYLTLTAAVAFENDDYVGAPITENTLTESLKAEYHLSRSIVLTGTLSHQRLTSTVPGSDYTQNVALIGLRLQH